MNQKRSTKIGDVIQISTSSGFAYAQLTHRHPLFGYLLRVLPGFHPEPLNDLEPIIQDQELYFTFVFKDDLFEPPTVSIVGHEEVPTRCRAFPLFRDGVKDPQTNRVPTWWLWDGKTAWRIGELSDEQKQLSIRAIWNYKILSDRVGSGWMPTDEC